MAATTSRKLTAPPLKSVRIDGGFWGPRVDANRRATIPHVYYHCKRTGRIDAWKLDWEPGQPNPPHQFWDSDVAKWLEAAAYSLATHPDPKLARRCDRLIDMMARAQQPDGYLNPHYTVVEPDKRWSNLAFGHELYCAGHLMEAAVAYCEATGKRKLLDVLCRYADYIGSVFGRAKGMLCGYPGHEEIELALVRLYRVTGQERHLRLAQYFVDERGRKPNYFEREAVAHGKKLISGTAYMQSHLPVRDQKAAVGHAVRAMYLYSAMADLAAETIDVSLLKACKRLWRNVTERRMYITGGIGSSNRGEDFTTDYDLPNEAAYAETCAAIGLVFWAHRMLQVDPDGRYADVMERALYNGVLSGISLDGRKFFYTNPLAAHPHSTESGGFAAREGRQDWFGCACCPPNIARLIASLGQYAYGQSARAAYVHLYVQGRAELELAGQRVQIIQKTEYPWKEHVRIAVRPDRPATFTLCLRMPGWCPTPQLALNGKSVDLAAVTRNGYAKIKRPWQSGDRVDMLLPMAVERIAAHPKVRANAGRVALQRGPIVYCLEEVDNGPDLHDLTLPRAARLRARFDPKLLGGVVAITGRGERTDMATRRNDLYGPAVSKRKKVTVKAVPYYAWANRKPGEMLVWIREA